MAAAVASAAGNTRLTPTTGHAPPPGLAAEAGLAVAATEATADTAGTAHILHSPKFKFVLLSTHTIKFGRSTLLQIQMRLYTSEILRRMLTVGK